jgi:Mg2+-importing ATPase
MICVTIGVLLPFSPLAHVLGFVPLPAGFLAALAVMIVLYLVLVELGKLRFYRVRPHGPPLARRRPPREHWIHHRATRWSIHGRPRRPTPAHQP